MKIFSFVLLFLSIFAFAEKDYDNAVKEYTAFPSSQLDEVQWLTPYDKTYLPYSVCSSVENFEVTNIDEKIKYYWDAKDGLTDIYHFYALVGIVRITYRVTCLNKLQYNGFSYFLSEPHKLNEFYNPSESTINEFKSHAHDWMPKSLSCLKSDGKFDASCSEFEKYNGKFDIDALKNAWTKQKVAYPEWVYTGKPGKKLPNPVLFIHGLGSDYEVWGVESTVKKDGGLNKGHVDFQAGKVKSYERGSAPDVLARTMNVDNSETNINENGIYFFQAPGELVGEEWKEAKPFWEGDAKNSQSKKLYEQIKCILTEFYGSQGIDWTKVDNTPIDLVAHSQGGLVVREMLRGLLANADAYPKGSANAANHIRKVVTVDTPHFGSELAVENSEDIKDDFPGLKLLIDDLDAQTKGTPNEYTLIEAKLNLNWFNYANTVGSKFIDQYQDIVGVDGPLAIMNVLNPIVYVLGWSYGAATDYWTDVNLSIKGPYLGKYKAYTAVDGPIDSDGPSFEIDILEEVSLEARNVRNGAKHLDKNSGFMRGLTAGPNNQGAYPRKPNGQNIDLLPLYSPRTKALLSQLLSRVAEGANELCARQDDERAGCFVIGPLFEEMAVEMASNKNMDIEEVTGVKINGDLWGALVNIQNTWFEKSDALVTETSQKFVDPSLGLEPGLVPEFEKPRSYLFHDAVAPWEDVLHGPLKINKKSVNDGASKQGLDIACALDALCNQVAEKNAAHVIYLNYGSVSFAGSFEVAPIYLNQGEQKITISDGTNYLSASYIPGTGSIVHYTDGEGNVVEDVLLDGAISTVPAISRNGNVIHVSFNNMSGKSFAKDYELSKLAEVATFSVENDDGIALPNVIMGVGSVSDPSTQVPPSVPQKEISSKSSIFVFHREARGQGEKNTSRPRILIGNTSDADVQGFKVAYYFTADPARKPVVKVDYPKDSVVLENLGGDQWRFVIDASKDTLKVNNIYPNIDGWQIRIHYEDWTDYKHNDDWSADYNIGIPAINKKIVVYDLNGKILWGQEPEIYKSQNESVVPLASATMAWFDSSPWETNYFKPLVKITNTGSVPLKNYKAKLWFRVPKGKKLFIPMNDWYTPESTPSVFNVADNVWEMDLYFDKHILYAGDGVQEGNVGLRLEDWSTFDKTVCGIALVDFEGNVIFGSEPSIETCESYDQPSLISSFYAWRY